MASISSVKTLKSTTFFLSLLLLQLSLINGHGGHDSSDTGNESLHSKHLIQVKVWCLIILLVSTFAAGVSPYFYRWNESFLLLGTQFAGGVFLGTSMMHFLSDSAGGFADLTNKTYPFAFMLASSGYLLTMLGDCVVTFVTSRGGRSEARVLVVEEGSTPEEQPKEVHVGHNDTSLLGTTTSLGDTILLILALCFHSIFEGIAVGVSGKLEFFPEFVFFIFNDLLSFLHYFPWGSNLCHGISNEL
jgi:zinc transporter 1/2/3